MVNSTQPSYNIDYFGAEFLLNYNLTQDDGISTGFAILNLSGNGFNLGGNFYHQRSLLKIPLAYIFNFDVSSHLSINMKLGAYGQTILSDEYQYSNNYQKVKSKGWVFGTEIGFGLLYKIIENYKVGINLNSQSDFSRFDIQNDVVSDKQKLKFLNSVGIILLIDL